ncbi:hypothetical protein JTB14_036177 [Gonioctena quinquepunctata]|nr:hypothetical protein JTB14_036177 [Gonioctena quinquepunctata]
MGRRIFGGRKCHIENIFRVDEKNAIAASSCADINTHNFHEKRVYENDKYQTKRNANIFSNKKFDKCPCCQKSHFLTDCQKFKKIGIDEKWKEVISNKLCFYCLKPAHNIYSCRLKQRCGIDGCQKFHNNILHNLDYKKRDEPQVEDTPDIVLDQDDHIEKINFFQEESPTILLRIIPVKLRGRKREISTFALLDEAATTTMIDSRIAQEIGLDGPLEPLCYHSVTSGSIMSQKMKRTREKYLWKYPELRKIPKNIE